MMEKRKKRRNVLRDCSILATSFILHSISGRRFQSIPFQEIRRVSEQSVVPRCLAGKLNELCQKLPGRIRLDEPLLVGGK